MPTPATALHRTLASLLLATGLPLALAAPPAETPFTGHWEDCENFEDVCFGYRLEQTGTRVCGSLTRVAKSGEGTAQHGHIRGEAAGALLKDVAVCGVEARSACPKVLPANRRGLLVCGDRMVETGGRHYRCADYAQRNEAKPYKRVSANDFDARFGPPGPSLCEVPATPETPASGSR